MWLHRMCRYTWHLRRFQSPVIDSALSSTACWSWQQRKYQRSAFLALCDGNLLMADGFLLLVMRKSFPCHDVIMMIHREQQACFSLSGPLTSLSTLYMEYIAALNEQANNVLKALKRNLVKQLAQTKNSQLVHYSLNQIKQRENHFYSYMYQE